MSFAEPAVSGLFMKVAVGLSALVKSSLMQGGGQPHAPRSSKTYPIPRSVWMTFRS